MTTEKINQNRLGKEDKKRKRKWPYILAIILLLLLLLLLLLRSCGNQHPYPSPNPPPSSSVPSSSAPSLDDTGSAEPGSSSTPSRQEILSRLQKQQVTVTDKVSAQASFSNGAKGSTGTWEVENPSSNTVIMQCEIVLNGETVAKSAPIYPGQHIDGLTLSKQVSPGNYSVTATIRYYNKTTKAYLGMADYKIRLSVS
jgi:cytoskeletal protein RodZ